MPKQKPYPKRKPDAKWFSDRAADVGLSRERLAEHFGTYPNMIWRMISGDRETRIAEAIEWAKVLKVPLNVILNRLGYEIPGVTCRLIGALRSTGRVSMYPPDKTRDVPAPADATEATVAIEVEGAHSALSVYDGATLYYEPSETVRPDAFGRLGLIGMADQPAPIIGILDRASMGKGRAVVWGTGETIESAQIVSATPILWQRAG